MRNPLFVAALIAFALLSAVSGLRLLHSLDQQVLMTVQGHASERLDLVAEILSLPGSVEVSGVLLLGLAVGLFMKGYQRLAVRLVIAFAVTGLLEISLKFLLPQVPIPEETMRITDQAPLVEFKSPYPYPSGHMLRSSILLGAVFMLWKNGLSRVLIVLALIGLGWGLIYLGVHWASDVIGGALLGIAGLVWAFEQSAGKPDRLRS